MGIAADLVFGYAGTIVSFNGERRDLGELRSILNDPERLPLGEHIDMLLETSKIRWPPDPETSPILGQHLDTTFDFFGGVLPMPPENLDEYASSVWRDCFQTAWLYKQWLDGKLTL